MGVMICLGKGGLRSPSASSSLQNCSMKNSLQFSELIQIDLYITYGTIYDTNYVTRISFGFFLHFLSCYQCRPQSSVIGSLLTLRFSGQISDRVQMVLLVEFSAFVANYKLKE